VVKRKKKLARYAKTLHVKAIFPLFDTDSQSVSADFPNGHAESVEPEPSPAPPIENSKAVSSCGGMTDRRIH